MPTFKNFKDLEKFAKQKVNGAVRSPLVRTVFADAMKQSVETEVYDAYEPKSYERRGDNGGLTDTENMNFTSHTLIGNTVISEFENLTVGQDSMDGNYISELIENGSNTVHTTHGNSENGWFELGEWSESRPFAQATANKLNNSTHKEYLRVVLQSEINN